MGQPDVALVLQLTNKGVQRRLVISNFEYCQGCYWVKHVPRFGQHHSNCMKCACLGMVGQSWRPVHHKGGDAQLPQENGQCKACGPSSSNENRDMLCATYTQRLRYGMHLYRVASRCAQCDTCRWAESISDEIDSNNEIKRTVQYGTYYRMQSLETMCASIQVSLHAHVCIPTDRRHLQWKHPT